MANSTFNGAAAVITGAASGMGRFMAIQAAQRGAYVIAVDVNAAGLEETKAMAQSAGQTIETHILDVADKQAIETFAQNTIPTLNNRKLVLINNAGVALLSGTFETTPIVDFEWLININLWGAIRMTKAFYPYLIGRGEGILSTFQVYLALRGCE